jgi:hypothetical protein
MSSAATAITIAPPSGIFDSRVSMLPRSSTKSRSGRTRCSCARRRTDPWPPCTPAPVRRGSTDERVAPGRVARRTPRSPARRWAPTGDPWPSAREVGTSVEHRELHLLDEHALSADRVQGTSVRTSPVVSTVTSSTARPVVAVIASATAWPDWPTPAPDAAWRAARVVGRRHGAHPRSNRSRTAAHCARPAACRPAP